eukprot:403334750
MTTNNKKVKIGSSDEDFDKRGNLNNMNEDGMKLQSYDSARGQFITPKTFDGQGKKQYDSVSKLNDDLESGKQVPFKHQFTSIVDIDVDLLEQARAAVKICKNPVKLTFEDVKFEVTVTLNKHDAKAQGISTVKHQIIKGVSGYAMPGQTCYIMGSSGAGKTSLLNIISDRATKRAGTILEGKVMINDTIPMSQNVFGNVAGYVMQDDILFQYYTPRQALRFAARLKLNHVPIPEQDERVETLLKELGLLNSADIIIGSAKIKTLSGGERKRVAIGVELITDPSLILLDEPTSGLDSFKALQIVKLLQRQARKGKTVIATIHQPGSESFACFDRLILMSDGHIMYQGDAAKSTKYFEKVNIPCPKFANPADFFMRVLTVNYPKTPSDEKKVSYLKLQYDQNIRSQSVKEAQLLQLPQLDADKLKLTYAPTGIQLKELIKRCATQMVKDPQAFNVKIFMSIFIGLLCLPIFWDLTGNEFVTQMGLAGFLFFSTISTLFTHMQGNLLAFQEERPVFLREMANKMYHVGPYYTAKMVLDLPSLIIQPMTWTIIVYFGVGLSITAGQFWYFYLIMCMLCISSSSFGFFISSLFSQSETALAVAPVIIMPMVLFSGFFSNAGTYPDWIGWIQWISPIRYSLESLIWNEFGDRQYATDEINLVTYLSYELGIGKCLAILAGLSVFFRVLTGVSLKMLAGKFQ